MNLTTGLELPPGIDFGAATDTLAFHALDDVDGTFSADVITGTGSLTEACTSTRYCPDDSNIHQPFATGVAAEYYAGGKWWLYGAPAATNLLTYSRDLTNAAWTTVGSPTVTYDQVGLTGAANTASKVEDTDGAAHEFISDAVTVTASAATHTARWKIDKDADTSRFVGCFFEESAGRLAWFHVNTSTGATAAANISNDASATIEVRDAGLWWEVLVSVDGAGVITTLNAYLLPADATVIGTRNVAATGFVICGNIEIHEGKTIAQVRGSSPIFTSGSTVTINKTDPSAPQANDDQANGAWYIEGLMMWDNSAVDLTTTDCLFTNTSSYLAVSRIRPSASIAFRASDGSAASTPSAQWNAIDTVFKYSVVYDGSSNQIVARLDGNYGTEATYDGSFFGTAGDILIGKGIAGTLLVRNLRRYSDNFDAGKTVVEGLDP